MSISSKQERTRRPNGRRVSNHAPVTKKNLQFKIHPLFLLMGVWYAFKGELFLFLLSTLVAVQHECAHAFASASLGYQLNKIVLMPYGAVIDGDLRGLRLKDEIFVALCGPLCNLLTAGFFVALWWLTPTMYAFTDTACYSSLTIALVNLLPAFPLDGGRVLKCLLAKRFLKTHLDEEKAERRAKKICQIVTLLFALLFLAAFLFLCACRTYNFSLFTFSVFLTVGAFGNRDKQAYYGKLNFFRRDVLKKGTEIKRVAVLKSCTIKQALRFLSRDSYLILEVYDEDEKHLFNLSQNELFLLFLQAKTPYQTLGGGEFQKNNPPFL